MKTRKGTTPTVDMTSAAVDRRLREASELRRLCLSLGRARRIGPVAHDGRPKGGEPRYC